MTTTKLFKETIIVAGLPVHVFSRDSLSTLSGDVALLFFLHGRTGSSEQVEPVVNALFKVINGTLAGDSARPLLKELIVVTFVSTSIS